jgi:uncharacterized phage protein (TIGR02218 family)
MTDARVTQAPVLAVYSTDADARATHVPTLVVYQISSPLRVTNVPTLAVYRVSSDLRIFSSPVLAVYKGGECGTRLCQIWTITRTDGEVYRFTSLDRDLTFGGDTYQACDSLNPSASESVSEVDSSGSMDLSGAIGPDGISKEDLYAGLFDGAKVEAWTVPWDGNFTPKLLLRGEFGPVEQAETGFKVELLGDASKLTQTPLVSLLEPGCRWKRRDFGGFGGPFCGKDLTGLIVTGTVDGASGQRSFTDAARSETAGYFSRGQVTFTSGSNAGVSAEIREHSVGGLFELWPRLPFAIVAGDQYSMKPGCTYLKAADGGTNGCIAWDNLLRYGGFDKAPGGDKRGKTPNAKV